jgi:hypothetical protein
MTPKQELRSGLDTAVKKRKIKLQQDIGLVTNGVLVQK